VVIDYLYGFGARVSPYETETVLVVYLDGMLAGAIPFEFFKVVARRGSHVL
jgi:hypothetical protein